MKKIVTHIIILSIFFINTQRTTAQRNVVWVHGLNDNANAWSYYDQIFQNELSEFTANSSLRQSYNTSDGITNAAIQVLNSVNVFGASANDPRNLGIGHSMGGLMIREVDRLTNFQNKKFGGYITVTSPNYGAPIANSLTDGSVQDAAQDACNKITDGPLSELLPLPWVIVPNLATDYLCDSFIDNDLIQDLVDAPQSVDDLKENSSAINAINNYTDNQNPDIPRISIWAEENSPVHWRLFSASQNIDEGEFVSKINQARAVYNSFYYYNFNLGIACSIGGILNTYCWAQAALNFYRASQWKKGRNWIDDSENIWNALIKTTKIEQHQVWDLVYDYYTDYNDCQSGYYYYDPTWAGDCGNWRWEYVTEYVSVNYPSDGLLPQYTQELQGIPDDNKYKVEGANHLEVLNMSNSSQGDKTYIVLKNIFLNRSDWFHTN